MNDLKSEFIKLAALSKWSQAEIARRLNMTPGGVSGIIKGEKVPGERLLELFRLKLFADQPGLLTAEKYPPPQVERIAGMDPPEINAAVDELRDIHATDSKGFEIVRQVIRTYHSQRPQKEPVSSVADRAVRRRTAAIAKKILAQKTAGSGTPAKLPSSTASRKPVSEPHPSPPSRSEAPKVK